MDSQGISRAVVLGIAGLVLLLCGGRCGAQTQCSPIYGPSGGWSIDRCERDPNVTSPMTVVVDGKSAGTAVVVRVYHISDEWPGMPQVAVVYASGFVRLKPNADPPTPVPFGTSCILGPAYRDAAYHHNPTLTDLSIDTRLLPNGPLRMSGTGTQGEFNVRYEMKLPPPRDWQTRLHVLQTATARSEITIDPGRRARHEGYKLIQFSSMFLNQTGTCAGGFVGCHDADAVRYIASDLQQSEIRLATAPVGSLMFSSPQPIGDTWLDVLHTDNTGWQGDTPNIRVALDAFPAEDTVTPQGFIDASTDPNDDNVGIWLHDDGPASATWTKGQSRSVGYWLVAQSDPPSPLADLGLAEGTVLLDSDDQSGNCFFVHDPAQGTSGAVRAIAGQTGQARELAYDIGALNGAWAQIRCNFSPTLDVSQFDHFRIDWRGSTAGNSIELAVVDELDGKARIFGRGWHHATQRSWWGRLVVPLDFLAPWTPGTTLNRSRIVGVFLSVVKDGSDDDGGTGSLAIDNFAAIGLATRTVPTTFETPGGNPVAARSAATWLASQQMPSGLVKSWEEEQGSTAHTYDQALALQVFTRDGMEAAADKLALALAAAQNKVDGSWAKSYAAAVSPVTCVHCEKWLGDIAWAVLALSRYIEARGPQGNVQASRDLGAAYVARQVAADDCLNIDHTEGTIDAWWALHASNTPGNVADRVATCLARSYWDATMGRFRGGRTWWQPFLDNQTWGSAYLRATCNPVDARRALSYASHTLLTPARGGVLHGADGQGGPWAVWNEGTAQLVAAGARGSSQLLEELLAQQRDDGAMPGSPDGYAGGGIWDTTWHGVAPTAWLYFALTGSPFLPHDASGCGEPPRPPRRHLRRR
jgi:hypothetical protein